MNTMKKEVVKAYWLDGRVLTEDSDAARELYHQSVYGQMVGTKVQLSLLESLYLTEKERVEVLDGKNRKMSQEAFIRKARKFEPNFWIRYCV
ncbi:hypothetical protein HYS48_00570, partial [Candidatus Woesearchaeota archaeon]|nr:hypothetical protein [Candidatus Woesearchaeota archaeon]